MKHAKKFFTIFFVLTALLIRTTGTATADDLHPIALGISLYEQDSSVLRGGVYYAFAPHLRVGVVSAAEMLLSFEGDQKQLRRRLDGGLASHILLPGINEFNVDVHTSVGSSKYSVNNDDSYRTFVENETGLAIGSFHKFLRLGIGTRINVDALGKKTSDLKGCNAPTASRELCEILFVYPYVGASWSM